MRKIITSLIILIIIIGLPAFSMALTGEEKYFIAPMEGVKWVVLRDSPSNQGKTLGKFYDGTPLKISSWENEWVRVSIGDIEGYLLQEDVTDIFTGSGEWDTTGEFCPGILPDQRVMYQEASKEKGIKTSLAEVRVVQVLGLVNRDWLYAYAIKGEEEYWGYLAGDDISFTENFATFVIDTGVAEKRLIMYDRPSAQGNVLGSYFSGTVAFRLFNDEDQGGFLKVRIEDQAGYVWHEGLDGSSGSYARFTPPLFLTDNLDNPDDKIFLYTGPDLNEKQPLLPNTMGSYYQFCVLGKVGEEAIAVQYYTGNGYEALYGYINEEELEWNKIDNMQSGDRKSVAKVDITLLERGEDGEYRERSDAAGVKKDEELLLIGESDPDAPLFSYGYVSHEDGIALVEAQISVAEDEGAIGYHTRGYVNLSDIEWNGGLAW